MTRRKINDLALKNRPTAGRLQDIIKFKCTASTLRLSCMCVSTNQLLSAISFPNKCERTSTMKRLYSFDTVEDEQIDASMLNMNLNMNCQHLPKA